MAVTPDFEGFAAAQRRLRESFGHDLRFYSPGEDPSWPPGTQLDPETDLPYDPTIEPVTGGDEVITTVRCSVVSRPMGLSKSGVDGDAKLKALGWVEEGGIVIIVDIEDWEYVRDATKVEYADETYAIRMRDHDYLGAAERYLLWAKQF